MISLHYILSAPRIYCFLPTPPTAELCEITRHLYGFEKDVGWWGRPLCPFFWLIQSCHSLLHWARDSAVPPASQICLDMAEPRDSIGTLCQSRHSFAHRWTEMVSAATSWEETWMWGAEISSDCGCSETRRSVSDWLARSLICLAWGRWSVRW